MSYANIKDEDPKTLRDTKIFELKEFIETADMLESGLKTTFGKWIMNLIDERLLAEDNKLTNEKSCDIVYGIVNGMNRLKEIKSAMSKIIAGKSEAVEELKALESEAKNG